MRFYKYYIAIILCAALILCTDACGNTTYNDLVRDASTETSALLFYVYDGEKINRSAIFKSYIEKNIIDEFNSVKSKVVKNWSPEKITLPIYGIQIGKTDGTSILAAWSNGYWIAQDGTVYSLDFDFTKLEQEYDWQKLDEFASTSVLPCSRLLTQYDERWYSKLLTPAVVLAPLMVSR